MERILWIALKLVAAVASIVFVPICFAYPMLLAIGASPDGRLYCRKCNSPTLRRMARRGAWQEFASRWFGLYPWECIGCRKVLLYRQRVSRSERTAAWAEQALTEPEVEWQANGEEQKLARVRTVPETSERVA